MVNFNIRADELTGFRLGILIQLVTGDGKPNQYTVEKNGMKGGSRKITCSRMVAVVPRCASTHNSPPGIPMWRRCGSYRCTTNYDGRKLTPRKFGARQREGAGWPGGPRQAAPSELEIVLPAQVAARSHRMPSA
uniref:Uncharacterized protein n=1 Tax=Anopheles atroparvus TaxID=41427 RepID=A0A182IWT6_ANOAO